MDTTLVAGLIGAGAAIVGALIGGIFALLGAYLGAERSLRGTMMAAEADRQTAYRASLVALQSELTANRALIQQNQGLPVRMPLLRASLDHFLAAANSRASTVSDPVLKVANAIAAYNNLAAASTALYQVDHGVPDQLQQLFTTLVPEVAKAAEVAEQNVREISGSAQQWAGDMRSRLDQLHRLPFLQRWLDVIRNPLPPEPPGMPGGQG